MKTKLLKNFAILSLGLFGLMIVGNNVFAGEDSLETKPTDKECDLCVVTRGGTVHFSCKPKTGVSCSDSHWSGASVYCNNAQAC